MYHVTSAARNSQSLAIIVCQLSASSERQGNYRHCLYHRLRIQTCEYTRLSSGWCCPSMVVWDQMNLGIYLVRPATSSHLYKIWSTAKLKIHTAVNPFVIKYNVLAMLLNSVLIGMKPASLRERLWSATFKLKDCFHIIKAHKHTDINADAEKAN